MTATTKSKVKATPAFAPYELSMFELPSAGVPAAFREYAEKAVAQAKDAYEQIKTNAEEANGILERTYAEATQDAARYGLMVIKAARANANAACDFAQDALAIKSLPELIEVASRHGRRQYEIVSAQTKELTALAQQVASRTTEQVNTGLANVSKQARVA
jgi:phasin